MASGPGPSPAETGALAWAAIDELSQRRRCPGARALASFVRETAAPCATPKNDPRTNVIDQGERATYCLGRDALSQLLRCLESCRLEGSTTHFSERQGTVAEPRSGLMLDYDVITAVRKPALSDRHYYRLAGAIAAALHRDVDLGRPVDGDKSGGVLNAVNALNAANAANAVNSLHVFFIVKPAATPLGGDRYKFGFHVLVPGVRLDRAYKKWFVREFAADPVAAAVLQELGAVDASGLDPGSASVPVLFFGSCKRGATPYVLGAALELTLDAGAPPVVRRLEPKDLAAFNLAAELGLVADAEYESGAAPLVRKRDFDCRPELAVRVRDWAERSAGGATPADELLLAEHGLSTLTLHNADARHLHALLDLLGEPYYTERNKWRDVVFALAGASDQYKPLAVWFSHKCPAKWADGGLAALDALWDEAVARRASTDRPLGLASVHHWARACDPARYAEVMERSYFALLTGFVYDHGGKLEHAMVAEVLHAMLGAKFCVDVATGPKGGEAYCWYEFVLPGQPMRPGEVWKWRREAEPDGVHLYLSKKFTKVLDQVSEHLEERRAGARDEGQAKYYTTLGKAFAATKRSFYNDGFKHGVIRQAAFLFRRRGFAEQLDRHPLLFGTLNGVLRLGPRVELIARFHEYPISRFALVDWKPFDPDDPWTRLVLDALAAIFVEPDARDWIIFQAAQSLSGGSKEGILLLIEGGGQNGKTAALRWFAKALGPYADKFNVQLLSSDREEADRPNSALMRFKYLNYAYCEETKQAQTLNEARMKEIVNPGDVSGRDLNSRQETFSMRCNFVVASQFSFVVTTTDHGTWRRIRHYTAKTKFRRNPDPNNPFERKEDQRFVLLYPNEPQFISSVLSVLCHYYERLQSEHGGLLKNVPCPTIDRETEAFRISQDSLHRWISETVVVSPKHEGDYSLGILGGHYAEWYARNVGPKRLLSGEVIKAIEASALGKFLSAAANRTLVLRRCRLLLGDDNAPRPGEEFFSEIELRGGRSSTEWATACAEAATLGETRRADGRPWWEARSTPAPVSHSVSRSVSRSASAHSVDDDNDDAIENDDRALLAAGRVATAHTARPLALTPAELDAVIDEALAAEPRPAPLRFCCDDVYDVAECSSGVA